MAQALTLEDAQIKRVKRYLKIRTHSVRDCTIFAFAFNTGLRAKELAALCVPLDCVQRNSLLYVLEMYMIVR